MRRVNESVRQVLSEAMPELKDPRIGFVTVTGVDTTPDLGTRPSTSACSARAKKRARRSRGLEAAHGVLQARIARELRLKRTPQLAFEYDPSVERGVRMTQADRRARHREDDARRLILHAVAEAIRAHDRFLVVTHENPDGDALGSLLATTLALDGLGKDSVMYLAGDAPLPREYAFMHARRAAAASCPADTASACSSRSTARTRSASAPDPELARARAARRSTSTTTTTTPASATSTSSSPTRRRPARCCATSSRELDVELTPEIAEALYIALVTDTGRFQYTNTTPKALRLAAELVEAGADVHAVFQQVYESVEFAKLKLLARALERARVLRGRADRRLVSAARATSREVGAAEPYSEGIIDYLRAVEGRSWRR